MRPEAFGGRSPSNPILGGAKRLRRLPLCFQLKNSVNHPCSSAPFRDKKNFEGQSPRNKKASPQMPSQGKTISATESVAEMWQIADGVKMWLHWGDNVPPDLGREAVFATFVLNILRGHVLCPLLS